MNADKKRLISLSWRLIEWKIMYYNPELIDPDFHDMLTISDDIYDQYEMEYLRLCRKLSIANTVVHKGYAGIKVKGIGMFEVDLDRPCVRLVLSKYGDRRKKR